jgi:ubiquinone/menaquinone biosynthesis C-methylase UbiE
MGSCCGKMKNSVREYYSGQVKREWKRLASNPFHMLEFFTTMSYLKKYLPKKGHILDAGGGPGRYTIELAKRGYKVTLLDLTPKLLRMAVKKIKEAKVGKNIDSIIEGDIRDLSLFKNNTFDAVICTGAPLSHVLKKSDRIKAIKEFRRVAKKGAPIFISVIGLLGVLVKSIWKFPEENLLKVFRTYRDTGDYFGGYGFVDTHMYREFELRNDLKKAGLTVLKTVGLEGLASPNEQAFNKNFRSKPINKNSRDKKMWNAWLQTHFKTCEIQSVADTSQHMLIVARK